MARPGVGADRIAEVIKQLEAEGREVTVTAVRERLGTGSFSTIGAVLADWRQSRAKEARPAVPEVPDGVRHLFTQLWGEAWESASRVHEPERQAIARERQENDRTRAEMLSEIERLEAALDQEKEQATRTAEGLAGERDRYRGEFDKVRAMLAEAHGALAETGKRIEAEEGRNQKLSAETAKAQAQAAELKAQVSHLKNELQAETDRSTRTVVDLSSERDHLQEELDQVKASLGLAEGALAETRKRVEQEDARNRELSERVIVETARAQSLAARVEELKAGLGT